MGLQFKIYEHTITLQKDNYDVCHEFSRDFIVGLVENLGINGIRNGVLKHFDALKCAEARNNIAPIYMKMITGLPGEMVAMPFDHAGCANIPVCSLILFQDFESGELQHSMITTADNEWTGANNSMSMGTGYEVLLSGEYINGVYKIPNMSQRVIAKSGWDRNMLHSALGKKYIMYYVPLLK